MTQKDNILQELKELQSSLANAPVQPVYQVPAGYFDGLAAEVLNRVKALETDDVKEELDHLSPLLAGISNKMPYSVPANFFNRIEERISEVIINENELSPAKELETLSPLLSGLKKETPYTVPQGYFENIVSAIPQETKVISLTKQKWFRMAAAAVVTGLIITIGFFIFDKPATIDPNVKPLAWVEKNLKKVSTDDIDKFVQLADVEEAPSIASVETKETNDIKELMKDVPDKDIQKFLDDTPADEPDNSDGGELLN
jgi:hypothetical protein